MKRAKGLLAMVMILTILLGNFVWANASTNEGEVTATGGFTTLEDPDPIRE